jgi:hypothetical protein
MLEKSLKATQAISFLDRVTGLLAYIEVDRYIKSAGYLPRTLI